MRVLTRTDDWDIPDQFSLTTGKVRNIYDLGDRLLIIATDRVSAFDCVLPNAVPGRGVILTQMTLKWLDKLKDVMARISSPLPICHHVVSTDVNDLPDEFKPYTDLLVGRFMIVDKCSPLPIEF
ncbi:hypothetical protein KKC06_02305, partial [Patescibacteria group bacterium]|nr:hypothetical protein [Patescibacteria group bacterium]